MKLTTDTRNILHGTEQVYQRTAEFGMQSFTAQYQKLTHSFKSYGWGLRSTYTDQFVKKSFAGEDMGQIWIYRRDENKTILLYNWFPTDRMTLSCTRNRCQYKGTLYHARTSIWWMSRWWISFNLKENKIKIPTGKATTSL